MLTAKAGSAVSFQISSAMLAVLECGAPLIAVIGSHMPLRPYKRCFETCWRVHCLVAIVTPCITLAAETTTSQRTPFHGSSPDCSSQLAYRCSHQTIEMQYVQHRYTYMLSTQCKRIGRALLVGISRSAMTQTECMCSASQLPHTHSCTHCNILCCPQH